MDAGLAAVLGAVAGSMATIGAAVAAGWAQREGARISARAEHRKERRQPRYDAYKALIQISTDLRDRVFIGDYVDPTWSEQNTLRKEVHARWIDLSLVGPASAITSGSKLRDGALEVLRSMGEARLLSDISEDSEEAESAGLAAYEDALRGVDEVTFDMINSLDEFALRASEALDDDGTDRPSLLRRLVRSRSPDEPLE